MLKNQVHKDGDGKWLMYFLNQHMLVIFMPDKVQGKVVNHQNGEEVNQKRLV